MNKSLQRVVLTVVVLGLVAVVGVTYWQSLVPAVHTDHDHGLENIDGGGFLRVEKVEGGRRNLVGRPDRVLILHWFEPGASPSAAELPHLIDYARSVADDPDVEVVLTAVGFSSASTLEWAQQHGVPTGMLYADPKGETANLMGVRRLPETFIYDPEGHLAHQARGPMNWADPALAAAIQDFKSGGDGHQH